MKNKNPDPSIDETAGMIGENQPVTHTTWPIVGTEAKNLKIPADSGDTILGEAKRVLSHCVQPTHAPDSKVGLVVGYVQSGKTLSFTTVAALARDNKYPLVIVITGTGVNLFKQSDDRLVSELRLETRVDRKWQHLAIDIKAPSPDSRMQDTFEDWLDPTTPPDQLQTVLVTVMKHHRHLDYLVRTLQRLDLHRVPTLIIDDEADQAGLNAGVNRNRQTSTYRQLLSLRRALPHHTYLQYTATPQAPLLINLIDALSPSFVEVLTPGPDYTGGKTFFTSSSNLIRTILPNELFTPTQNLTEPPASYRLALATFFIGVAAGILMDQGSGNRSMLVHPHQTTNLHSSYVVWARAIKKDWMSTLSLALTDPDRIEIEAFLGQAYADLENTVKDIPSLKELMPLLMRAIRKTDIHEVNASGGVTPTIDWKNSYSHILVGGQAMDRGFTVEGLTVTYMPRGLGTGNADTVQQRARFFGYKNKYLGYCRVWLESDVEQAFFEYVTHEESMREQLIEHSKTGKHLREWKRKFFLDNQFRPTRREVLSIAYTRGNHGGAWVHPSRPHDVPDFIVENNDLISKFLEGLTLLEDPGHPSRTASQRHLVAYNVNLSDAYKNLLSAIKLTDPEDSNQNTGMLLQIKSWIDKHPDARCSIYVVAPGEERERTRTTTDEINKLFQGANPSSGPHQGEFYPGDSAIRHSKDVTIQVHTLKLNKSPDSEDQIPVSNVRLLAVYVPSEIGKDWLAQ